MIPIKLPNRERVKRALIPTTQAEVGVSSEPREMSGGSKLIRRGKPQALGTMFPLTDRATHFGIPVF